RSFFCFFFQAEDGIRDKLVTGVQTCALPIFGRACPEQGRRSDHPVQRPECRRASWRRQKYQARIVAWGLPPFAVSRRASHVFPRSEERRVGKECNSSWGW